jgi:aminotransferase
MRDWSRRTAGLEQSEIRAMTIACDRVEGINMAQGVCDTGVPEAVRRGAQRAMDRGLNTYSRFDGLAELREAIAEKAAAYNGLLVDPETEITVSAGATGAFHCACLALLNPGDEVVLFEPYYGYHVSALHAVEAVPRLVPTRPPGWTFSPADLDRAITPRTAAIVVNSPGNPSGKVFGREELEAIAEVVRRRDLLLFTDEIYEYFLYDGRTHVSPASLPGMAERTITISGYSKTFAITGWRIGYSLAPARFARAIGAMNDLLYVCAPTPLQAGVAAGIRELGPDFYRALSADYQRKRDRFCLALQRAGLPPLVPQGAYYALADVSRLPGVTGRERALHLLTETGVAGVPGEAFYAGPEGARLLRFCFAKTDADLEEAARRIEKLG